MISKGVIIVPCWRRPDFLWACLHCLKQARGFDEYEVMIAIDREPDIEVERVALAFRNAHRNVSFYATSHSYPGNSYNVLMAYRRALSVVDPPFDWIIHLVEEDVFVGKDYLRFHERVHEVDARAAEVTERDDEGRAFFGVSACRDQNAPLPAMVGTAMLNYPHGCDFAYRRPTYQSLGVSFRPSIVHRFLEHATDAYFRDPVGTLATAFPESKIPRGNAEQDGLIGRVLEAHPAKWMVYPVAPRAFHAGFVGYNRSGGLPLYDGTPEERGRQLLAMSQDEMNRRADGRFRDIERCDLEMDEPGELTIVL